MSSPSDAIRHYEKGCQLLNKNKPAEALIELKTAWKLSKGAYRTSAMLCAMGNALKHLGRLDEAMVKYDEAIAADGIHTRDVTHARFNKACLLTFMQKIDDAFIVFQELADTAPRSSEHRAVIAHALCNSSVILLKHKHDVPNAVDRAVDAVRAIELVSLDRDLTTLLDRLIEVTRILIKHAKTPKEDDAVNSARILLGRLRDAMDASKRDEIQRRIDAIDGVPPDVPIGFAKKNV